jgi:hypothetical protein
LGTSEEFVINKLKQIKKIIAHRSCPDGTMAALICAAAYQKALSAIPKIEFIQYGTKEERELQPEPGQLFVDIAPPEDRWEEWKDVEPIVLDHHETREHITKGLGGIYGYPEFSGASLAFMHVMTPLWEVSKEHPSLQEWAEFAVLAQTRDNWQTDSPVWLDAAALGQGLMFFGSKLLLDELGNNSLNLKKVLEVGRISYDKILRKAGYVAESAYYNDYGCNGEIYKLGVFNSTEKNISEVGHILLEEKGCDLAAGFFIICQEDKLRIIVSVRTGDRLNARKIAEVFGGGGHPKAAGFKMDGPGEHDARAHTLEDITQYIQSGIGHSIRGD